MMPAYPISLHVEYPQRSNRLLGLVGIFGSLKGILLLPHIFVFIFLAIWMGIISWVNFWIILFTGKGSASIQRYQHGLLQWGIRLSCWQLSLVDTYPPFSLETSAK